MPGVGQSILRGYVEIRMIFLQGLGHAVTGDEYEYTDAGFEKFCDIDGHIRRQRKKVNGIAGPAVWTQIEMMHIHHQYGNAFQCQRIVLGKLHISVSFMSE